MLFRSIQCYKDGPCTFSYDCDPTIVTSSCDSDGDGDSDDTCSDTDWDRCPYFTEEWVPVIRTTVDGGTGRNPIVGPHVVPSPEYRILWRAHVPAPSSTIEQNSNLPQFFLDIQRQVREDIVAPTWVVRNTYDSYVLASNIEDPSIWLSDIEKLKTSRLMPVMQSTVDIRGQAIRVHFSGMPNPPDYGEYQLQINRFDAVLGDMLQGYLHVVIINKGGLDMSMNAMLHAIKYQWQDKSVYGDNTFAKNGVLVVLETLDNITISRAGLITGMPEESFAIPYNLDLQRAVEQAFNGKGIAINPAAIFGKVETPFEGFQGICDPFNCTRTLGNHVIQGGALSPIIFGLTDPNLAFQRISMSAEDPDDVGPGFVDLDKMIVPTPKQQRVIIGLGIGLSLIIWGFFIYTEDYWKPYSRRRRYNDYTDMYR